MEKTSTTKEPVPVYYREGDTTVCLLVANPGKVISRGVSICSEEEEYESKVGMAKSRGKAMQARHHRKNVSPVREVFDFASGEPWPENLYHVRMGKDLGFELKHKGMYQPKITERERRLAVEMESEVLDGEENFDIGLIETVARRFSELFSIVKIRLYNVR